MPGQRSRVRGDRGFRNLLRQLAPAAREEMADILDAYGDKLLAAIRADVPVKTGNLQSLLSKRLSRKSLILRVGFVGKRANGRKRLSRKVTTKFNGKRRKLNDQFVGNQFYGRFVEFGRKYDIVRVTRKKGAKPYSMRVRAMAARPFVFKKRDALRSALRERLQTFWNNTLASAATGAGDD